MLNIFKNLSLKNKILIISTLIIVLIAVPLTIFQSLSQQNTKQRASNDSMGFSIMLVPASVTKNIGEDMEVEVHLLNSQQKEISAVDVLYNGYNSNMFESVVFQPSAAFAQDIDSGGHFVGLISPTVHVNGADIVIGTLKFIQSKEAGTVNLNFNIRVNIPGIRNAILLDNISGEYTIKSAQTSSSQSPAAGSVSPTPTPIIIVSPTAIPAGSSPTYDQECIGSCMDNGYATLQYCQSVCIISQ